MGKIGQHNTVYEPHIEDVQLLSHHIHRGQFPLTQTKSILIGIQHQFLQFNPGLECISAGKNSPLMLLLIKQDQYSLELHSKDQYVYKDVSYSQILQKQISVKCIF